MSVWRTRSHFYNITKSLPFFNTIYQQEIHAIQQLLDDIECTSMLDLGSGTGISINQLRLPGMCVLTDKSVDMLKKARVYQKQNLVVCDAMSNLPFRTGSFKLITAIGLFEYLENAVVFFSEIDRILERGGYFVFTSSPPGVLTSLRSIHGVRLFPRSKEEVTDLLTNNSWHLLKSLSTIIQDQWLCQKE